MNAQPIRALELESEAVRILGEEIPALAAVQAYAGQLEAEAPELAVRTPSAFVAWGGSEFQWVDSATWREEAALTVLVAARGASEGASLARDMASAVFDALAGRRLHPDAEALMPVRASLVFTSRLLTVAALEFRMGFDRASSNDTDSSQEAY